jgi:viroplasmin and RNaseH domain-containing protein
MSLKKEAETATELLKGKIVAKVYRHRAKEVCIKFTDGATLFVDHNENNVEISITGGDDEEE